MVIASNFDFNFKLNSYPFLYDCDTHTWEFSKDLSFANEFAKSHREHQEFRGDNFFFAFRFWILTAVTIFAVVLFGNVTVEHSFAFKAELRYDL